MKALCQEYRNGTRRNEKRNRENDTYRFQRRHNGQGDHAQQPIMQPSRMQTVGAFLVICLVVTPGATAWLLTDRFPRLLMIAVTIGSVTSFLGAWVSYFLDGATGGIIVVAQTLLFLLAFVFAPTHGLLANRRRAHKALEDRS
jgi:hypothetical protein